MLHLQASLATAATGGDPRDHLEHAAEYAARLDRPYENPLSLRHLALSARIGEHG
ncbi:hypothetical protein [Nocardia sp. R6R-6]|uniref:hypothetical protein n=1 Tax=Nocardia sp. R6R-6 TaxID=3459303 RepID=UPI00403E22B0